MTTPVNPYTAFPATLAARTPLSPHLVRLTFADPALRHFGGTRLDQRFKLVLADPQRHADVLAAPDWATWWRTQPAEERPIMRTYTVRYADAAAGTVDIDVVAHGTQSPAGRFALEAPLGSAVILVGPDARQPGHDTVGIAYRPGGAGRVLLVGDETALPAIANILEQHAGTGARITACVEVPTAADVLDLPAGAGDTVTWLPREDAARGGPLGAAVAAWVDAEVSTVDMTAASPEGSVDVEPESDTEAPDAVLWEEAQETGGLYVWVAADAPTVKEIRRLLVAERGFDRRRCSFMGYWKPGVSGN